MNLNFYIFKLVNKKCARYAIYQNIAAVCTRFVRILNQNRFYGERKIKNKKVEFYSEKFFNTKFIIEDLNLISRFNILSFFFKKQQKKKREVNVEMKQKMKTSRIFLNARCFFFIVAMWRMFITNVYIYLFFFN